MFVKSPRFSIVCLTALLASAGISRSAVVATYGSEFQGTAFPAGWQYLWNAPAGYNPGVSSGDGSAGAIGNPANYVPLLWNGADWTPDGDATTGNNQPAGFSRLGANLLHPALGATQLGGVGNTLDRYIIMAYTIQPADGAGTYSITDSTIQRLQVGGNGTQAVSVLVHVNANAPVFGSGSIGTGDGVVSFNTSLGDLNVGDTVYVAVGPDGAAGTDSVGAFNFSLDRIPEPSAAAALLVAAAIGLARRRRHR